MPFANLDTENFPAIKISRKLLQLVASDLVNRKRMTYIDYLVKRVVDKLKVGGIVFHKHNFLFKLG